MHLSGRKLDSTDYTLAALLALFCVLILQVWQVRIGLSLSDEGLLWYDVQRTMAGELPLRDFQPYDPGRYYLFAAWAKLVGSDGIVALRYGDSLLQLAILIPAILLLARVLPSRWLLPPFAIIAASWMAPRHKLIDVAASVFAVAILSMLAARHRRGNLLTGISVGLLWFIGRNHAAYAGGAAIIVLLTLAASDRIGWRQLLARIAACAAGVILGAIPMLAMLFFIPGYAAAYWENGIARFARLRVTNLPLPVPWPWTHSGMAIPALGLGYVLVPAAIVASAILLFMESRRGRSPRVHPILLASAACALTWAHHMFARPAIATLAESGFPLVLAVAALPQAVPPRHRQWTRCLAWGLLAIVTIGVMPRVIPRMAAHHRRAQYVWADVAGERLYLEQSTLNTCKLGLEIKNQLHPGQTAIFAPYVPGLYAVTRLWCPLLETYLLLPESLHRQEITIQRMNEYHSDWALIWPDRVDDRPDLGFDQTHPLVYQYVLNHFDLLRRVAAAGDVKVFHRRDAGP